MAGVNLKAMSKFKNSAGVVNDLVSAPPKNVPEVSTAPEIPKPTIEETASLIATKPKRGRPTSSSAKSKPQKKSVPQVGADSRMAARVSEDFYLAFSLYCAEQKNGKTVDVLRDAVASAVGFECDELPLVGTNCFVSIPSSAKVRTLYARVEPDLKKAVRLYVVKAKMKNPNFCENYLIAQAVADRIGYKKLMNFD